MVLTKKELGNLIKNARKRKSEITGNKYTQKMLADDLGISRGYIGDIETGRTYPSYILLSKIANECGVPISYFQTNVADIVKGELSDYPNDLVDSIIHTVEHSSDMKIDFINDNSNKISLSGFFTKKELESDIVNPDLDQRQRLKMLMEQKNINIDELAKISGVSTEEIQLMVLGDFAYTLFKISSKIKLTFSSFRKVAKSLGTTVEFLLGETNYKWTECGNDSLHDIVKDLLTQPSLVDFCKYDLSKLSTEELNMFSKDVLTQIKLVSYKYSK